MDERQIGHMVGSGEQRFGVEPSSEKQLVTWATLLE